MIFIRKNFEVYGNNNNNNNRVLFEFEGKITNQTGNNGTSSSNQWIQLDTT